MRFAFTILDIVQCVIFVFWLLFFGLLMYGLFMVVTSPAVAKLLGY